MNHNLPHDDCDGLPDEGTDFPEPGHPELFDDDDLDDLWDYDDEDDGEGDW